MTSQLENMFTFDLKESLPKSLFSGASYAAGTMLIFPNDIAANINIGGVQIPVMALTFGAGVVGSLAGDIAAALLFPLIPANERIKSGSTALTDALISGGVECVILKLLAGVPMDNVPKLLFYSATHNMANEWLYSEVISGKGFAIL